MITAPPPLHIRPHSGAMCIIVRCNAHIMVCSVCFCHSFIHTETHTHTHTHMHTHTGWSYSSGFVNADMISAHLPAPGPHSQILMCGPPPMIKFACLPNLEKLGFSEDMYVPF